MHAAFLSALYYDVSLFAHKSAARPRAFHTVSAAHHGLASEARSTACDAGSLPRELVQTSVSQ